MNIRLAQLSDLSTLVSGNLAMASETEDLSLDPAVLEQGTLTLLRNPERGQYFIAEREGQTLGHCMVTYEWSDWHCAQYWWIQSVYVFPEARQQGVFKNLYEHVRTLAKSKNAASLRLYVERENKIAQQVYNRLGMMGDHYWVMEQRLSE